MAGVWSYLIPFIVIVALGAAVSARRRLPKIQQDPGRCSNCETPMSLRRVSILESLTLRGTWKCPHCGNRIKRGRSEGTAT